MPGLLRNRYLVSAALTFFLLASMLIATSYRIDPFRLYRWQDTGYENNGFELFWYLRLHKPYRMEAVRADALVLGNSRSAQLPPQLLAEESLGVGYNASIPGATLYEILRLMEHAQAIRPLHTVVLGLDYRMFRASQEKFIRGFVDDRQRKSTHDQSSRLKHILQHVLDLWGSLFSRSALTADISVIKKLQKSQRSYQKDGTWSINFAPDEKPFMYAMLVKEKFEKFSKDSGELNFATLQRILEFCNQHKIKLILILSPTHAHHMNVIHEAGAWPAFIEYQSSIINIVQKQQQFGTDVQVYGLDHQRPLIFEAVDAQQDWFRDGIHFSRDTGNNIMRCLFSDPTEDCDQRRSPLKLTNRNAAQYLSTVSSNKNAYATAQPKWFRALQEQIEEHKSLK